MLNSSALDSTLEQLHGHLEEYLKSQGVKIDPANKKFSCINPEHKDSTPSSAIVPDSNGAVFHCFGCGVSGDIFHAAAFIEGLPRSGPGFLNSTIKVLCQRFNVPIPDIELTPEQQELLEVHRAYESAGRIIKYSTVDRIVPAFEDRGWPENIGVRYSVGFVDTFDGWSSSLRSESFTDAYLNRIGLLRKDIFNEDRMIFAIQDHHGTVVGFAARNLNYENDKSLPKYINSSSDSPLYRKREILYGLHVGKAPAVKNGLIIVEGYADWISLQEIGIKNCAAVCGTALTKEHIHLLTGLGISKITICLDNDDGGNLGTLRILDDVITEVPNLQVELIRLPEGSKDPDKYLRNFSPEDRVNAWRNLKPVSCFEWRLAQFPEDMNGEEIAKKMVPLIITEPNLITRERMAKELSKRSDIRLSAIQGQIDKISKIEDYKKSEQLVSIVKTAITDLKKDPGSAREIFSQYLGIIEQTHQASSLDLIGPDEMVNAFNTMADDWAKEKKSNIVGIATHFSNLDEVTNGLQEGRVIGVGGKPNHGKSAFVLSIAHSVASRNPDAIVIVHSTDDNREVVLSRLVAIDQGLDINTITNPRWFLKLRDPIKVEGGKSIVFDPEGQKKWKTGRDNISNLLKNGKLVVKDSSQGSTLGFTETLIKYYKEKFPEKRILVIFDNFHKAQDYMQFDERIRFKKMSHQCKMLAEKYHVAFIATMEYTKLGPGIRPENSDLAETVQMEYDLSIIMHVYNELKDLGKERAKHVTITGEGANAVHQPIVDIRVGKNKQTAFQDRIYFDFDSSKGKFTETTADRVRDILQGQDSSRKLSGLGGSK